MGPIFRGYVTVNFCQGCIANLLFGESSRAREGSSTNKRCNSWRFFRTEKPVGAFSGQNGLDMENKTLRGGNFGDIVFYYRWWLF